MPELDKWIALSKSMSSKKQLNIKVIILTADRCSVPSLQNMPIPVHVICNRNNCDGLFIFCQTLQQPVNNWYID